MRSFTHSSIVNNTNDDYVRVLRKDKNGDSASAIFLCENNDEHVFQAVDLILKVQRLGSMKVAKRLLVF